MFHLLLLALHAAVAAPPSVEWKKAPTPPNRVLGEGCYPSGLRVTVREDHRQPVVSVTATVARGSWDDAPGKEGATHLVEHLWLHARPGGGDTVQERLLALGARWTARTLPHATVWAFEAPKESLEGLLALQASLLDDPLAGIDEATFAAVRDAVAVEVADPAWLAVEDLPRLLAPDLIPADVGSITLLETPEGITRLTLADVRAAAEAYAPATVNLVVAGDIERNAALRLFQSVTPEPLLAVAADGSRPAQGACHARELPTLSAPPTRRKATGVEAVQGPVEEPRLLVGWALPSAFGPDAVNQEMAAYLYEWRLYSALVFGHDAKKERFDPRCTWIPDAGTSAIVCSVKVPTGTNPAKMRDLVLKTVPALAVFATDYAAETAMVLRHRGKRVVDAVDLVADVSPLHSDTGLIDTWGNHATGSAMWFVERLEALSSFDADRMRDWAKQWLAPDRAVVRLVVPPGIDPAAAVAWNGKVDLSGRADRPYLTDPRVVAWKETPHLYSGALPATPPPAPTPNLPEVHEERLPNGVRVLVARTSSVPWTRVAVVTRSSPETEPVPGLEAWAWSQHVKRTEGLPTRANYTDTSLMIGTHFREGVLPTGRFVSFDGTFGSTDAALWLSRFMADNTVLDPSSNLRAETRRAAESIVTREAGDPDAVAYEKRMAALLGPEHPLAMTPWRRFQRGASVPEAELKGFLDRSWEPEELTAVVLGGVDVKKAVELARAMFQDQASSSNVPPRRPPYAPPAFTPASRTTVTLPDPSKSLARVHVACRVGADEVVGEVGRRLVADAVTRTTPGAAVDLHRWRDDVVLEVSFLADPAAADGRADAVTAALASLASGAEPAWVAAAGARAAADELLRTTDDEVFFDLLLQHGSKLPEVLAARPDQLRAVKPDAVATWLEGCVGRESISVVGPAR